MSWRVGHDLALLVRQRGRVALGADQVDRRLPHPSPAGRPHLGRPHVGRLALPHGGQDRQRAQPALHHAPSRKNFTRPSTRSASAGLCEQDAEGAADVAEDLDDGVDHAVVFGRHVGFPVTGATLGMDASSLDRDDGERG